MISCEWLSELASNIFQQWPFTSLLQLLLFSKLFTNTATLQSYTYIWCGAHTGTRLVTTQLQSLVNPRRASTARVTVVCLCGIHSFLHSFSLSDTTLQASVVDRTLEFSISTKCRWYSWVFVDFVNNASFKRYDKICKLRSSSELDTVDF